MERLVGSLPGVERANVGGWTSSLLIHYNPTAIGSSGLLRLVEGILDDSSGWGDSLPQPTRTRFGAANATLGIAAIGEYLVPVLTPVSAVMLVAMNVRTFRYAWLQIRRRKFGLPVLYTTIIAATLASGQFLASSLMYWFFTFWHGRLRLELAGERRRLLDECLPRPSFTSLITPEGSEVLVSIGRLRAGDRVAVGADETVPADGRVIGGEGIVRRAERARARGGLAKTSRGFGAGRLDRAGRLVCHRGHPAGRPYAGVFDRPGPGRGDEPRGRPDVADSPHRDVRRAGGRTDPGDGRPRPAGRRPHGRRRDPPARLRDRPGHGLPPRDLARRRPLPDAGSWSVSPMSSSAWPRST